MEYKINQHYTLKTHQDSYDPNKSGRGFAG
jgi:hypothetical protein